MISTHERYAPFSDKVKTILALLILKNAMVDQVLNHDAWDVLYAAYLQVKATY